MVAVNADIFVVPEHVLEAGPADGLSCGALDSAPVQVINDIDMRLPLRHPGKDLPDDLGPLLINGVLLCFRVLLVAEWHLSDGHAFGSRVPEASSDVFAHILGVILVEVHHEPVQKAASSIVIIPLLDIDTADASFLQALFVGESVDHVPVKTVGLPGHHHIKVADGLSIPHQLLVLRPGIRPSGDRMV